MVCLNAATPFFPRDFQIKTPFSICFLFRLIRVLDFLHHYLHLLKPSACMQVKTKLMVVADTTSSVHNIQSFVLKKTIFTISDPDTNSPETIRRFG